MVPFFVLARRQDDFKMTMQSALLRAQELGVFARPVHGAKYSYRYVEHGRDNLIHVSARDRKGNVQSGVWRTLTQREMEDEWTLCDLEGHPMPNPTTNSNGAPRLLPKVSDLLVQESPCR